MNTKRSIIFLFLCSICFAATVKDDLKPFTTDTYDLGSSSLKWEDGFFNGNIGAATYTGDGSGLTGIGSGTGGVINTGSTTIGADSDSDGVGIIVLQTRGTTRLTVANNGDIIIAGTITGGTWNGTAIDISSYTNLVAGTNITLSGDTLNVDDAFLVNDASDTTTGVLTTAGVTITTGNALTLGTTQWDDGSDKIEGNNLADDSVDDDALDFTSITLNDFTVDIASTQLTDTTNILYIADLNTFSELQTLIADKTLLNEEDTATIDSAWVFSGGITGTLTGNVVGDLQGNADTAELLETTRAFSVSGDVTTAGGVNFNGGGDVDLAVSIAAGAIVDADISPVAAIDADKLTDGSTNIIPTATQETNWDAHLSSDGSDHTFIDQDVTSGSSPTFTSVTSDNTNMTGNVSVWTNDAGYITSVGGETEAIQDVVGGMVTGNTEVLIAVTYQDSDGTLDFVVDEANIDHDALTNFVLGEHFLQSNIIAVGTIAVGAWNGTPIDIGDYTNLVAGTNITLTDDTLDVDNPIVADITGDLTGNADTATALATGRTIGMTGDVVWTSPSFDGSTNVTAVSTIQPNSVALKIDTTGDYVDSIEGEAGIDSGGATSGEGVAHNLSFDATELDALTWSDGTNASNAWSFDVSGTDTTITFGNDLITISNSLTVATGKNITLGTTQWSSSDEIDGSKIKDADYGDVDVSVGGAWTVSSVQADSIVLATDTTGDYVADITGGTGVDSTGATSGENISHTLSFDSTEIAATTWSDGSNATNIWTFDVSGTDTTMTADSGRIIFSKDVIAAGALASNSFSDGVTSITGGNYTLVGNITGTDVDISAGTGNISTSGSLTLSGLTPGSILFAGTGGVVSEDNSEGFYDSVNKYWGFGTATPGTKVEIQGTLSFSESIGSGSPNPAFTKVDHATTSRLLIQPTSGNSNMNVFMAPSGANTESSFQARNSSDVDNTGRLQLKATNTRAFLQVGKFGTGTVPGGLFIGGDNTDDNLTRIVFTFADVEKVRIQSSGFVGIGENAPETFTEWTGTAPYLTLHNSTHEDGDGGRESIIQMFGEQTGGEETTLVKVEASHDGAADDQKGKLIISTNDGTDGDSPTAHVKIDAAGITYIGDAGTTNYTKIEADGTIELNGAATVFDDIRTPMTAIRITGPGGTTPPDEVLYKGSVVLAFGGAGTDDEKAFFTIQIPHWYKEGSDIVPHIHWTPEDNTAGNVRWVLTHSWANIDAAFPGESTDTIVVAADETTDKHQRDNFTTISGAGKTISSMILCSIQREDSDGTDTYNNKDAYLTEIDFHAEKDTMGSRLIADSK